MRKKTVIFVLFLMVISVFFAGFFLLHKKSTEPEYMPCPVLANGETRDVMIPKFMHYGNTAIGTANYMIKEKRCIDAWVNEDGLLVIRLDQDTLEKNYKIYYDALMKEVNYEGSNTKVEVSYDYSVLTIYVNDNTTLEDFGVVMMVTPGNCYILKLMHGIPLEEVNVDVVVIYEPTGKEILRLDGNTEMHLEEDDWERILGYGRQEL